jgi:glycosyltransferase involved in cell wall biosynthesis
MVASRIPEISIILPCRNEEKALPFCLNQVNEVIKEHNLNAEVIVSDSSSDRSPSIALEMGAILVKHDKEGYGNAYLEGFKVATGKYIFMADADGSYDFRNIPRFIRLLKDGNDIIIGNRFGGEIDNGAMPFLHKHVGNPVLSNILAVFFGNYVSDSHSGMRAIKRESLDKLNLQTAGMEFASEMIVKAIREGLIIREVSIKYHKRIGDSKLETFSDGWKHLRFMLLYSPMFLFFVPGILLFILGVLTLLWFYFGSPNILGIQLYYHPMFFCSALVIIGYQLIIFSAFAKSYAYTHLHERNELLEKVFKHITIERASVIGILMSIIGVVVYGYIFFEWISSGLGSLNEVKSSILALTFVVLGIQTIFSSFMLSILGIKEK